MLCLLGKNLSNFSLQFFACDKFMNLSFALFGFVFKHTGYLDTRGGKYLAFSKHMQGAFHNLSLNHHLQYT
jgi:hypothetical protein